MNSIAGAGAYVPTARVPAEEFADAWGRFKGSGISAKAVLEADEDTVTMAFEAAIRALAAAGLDGKALRHLMFATTTPPMAEEDLTPRLGEMLGVDEGASCELHSGSTAAGIQALLAGVRTDAPTLVVASDTPQGSPDSEFEHAAGTGAAAFVLTVDGPGRIIASGSASSAYPGTRFRRYGDEELEGLGVTTYDRDAFVGTIAAAAEEVEYGPVDAAAVQAPNGRLPYRLSEPLGIDDETIQACTTVHDIGDTGTASVPLSLAKALGNGAETVLCAGYGSGAKSVVLLVESEGVPVRSATKAGRELDYASYLRRRGDITSGEPAGGGAYVSVPSWRRSLAQRYRLEAGQCRSCGSLNFLPEGACKQCHDLTDYKQVQLSRKGTIEAVSIISQGGAPPEFAEQQARQGDYATAIVAFDGPDGDSASAPALVVDADPESVAVDDRVLATIRRIYEQEGVIRYGFKVKPSEDL